MSTTVHQTRSLGPYDIIFSCSVCHCTVSDAYHAAAGTETLRGTSTPEELGPVRIWLTDCDHVTCATHLEGGGLPFHKAGEKPKAPCPICSQKGDSVPKVLYALHRNASQNHNSRIPHPWFSFPPSNPTSATISAAEKSSHEFQLSQLVKYGLAATEELQNLRRDGERLRQMQQRWKEAGARIRARDEKVRAYVRSQEQKSQEWETRRAYVQAVTSMSQNIVAENDMLRRMLAGVVDFIQFRQDWAHELQKIRTAYGPQSIAQGSVRLGHQPLVNRTGEATRDREAGTKRPRSEFEQDLDSGVGDMQERSSSRDAMPPPPHPSSNLPGLQVLQDHDRRQTIAYDGTAQTRTEQRGLADPFIGDTRFGPQDTIIPQAMLLPFDIGSSAQQQQNSQSPHGTAKRQALSYIAPPSDDRRAPHTSLRGGTDGRDSRAKLPPGLQTAMRDVRRSPQVSPQELLQNYHPGRSTRYVSEPPTSHDKRSYGALSQLVPIGSGLRQAVHGRRVTTPSQSDAGGRAGLRNGYLHETVRTPSNGRGPGAPLDSSRSAISRYANDIYREQSLRTADRNLASVLGTPTGRRVIRR